MGIRDISVLIKRFASNAVIPHRTIAAFSGKRFALDANLLLTKFHFAGPADLPGDTNGAVKEFYHFLMALQSANITPIVVFDGDSRLPAKAIENQRRTDARALQVTRGAAEGKRTARLTELRSMWELEGLSTSPEVLQGYREVTQGTARIALIDDRGEAQVERLVQLYKSFEVDEKNPVYSQNQRKIVVEERTFFDSILNDLEQPVDELERSADLANIWSQSTILEASLVRRSISVSRDALANAKQLVNAMGLAWYKPPRDSPAEAEGLCTTLYNRRLVDIVASEDTDVAVYGAPLLRRVSTRNEASIAREDQRRSQFGQDEYSVKMNVLDPVILKEQLGLSQEEFIDLALLCGTDFTERIPGLGPLKALKHIQQHRTIEAVLSGQRKYQPLDAASYMNSVEVARDIFRNPPVVQETETLLTRKPDPYLDELLAEMKVYSPSVY